jgi:hypothetical protein
MKVDFVTLSVASGGDFFNYKAITGMWFMLVWHRGY